jgi:hypothetical protein
MTIASQRSCVPKESEPDNPLGANVALYHYHKLPPVKFLSKRSCSALRRAHLGSRTVEIVYTTIQIAQTIRFKEYSWLLPFDKYFTSPPRNVVSTLLSLRSAAVLCIKQTKEASELAAAINPS